MAAEREVTDEYVANLLKKDAEASSIKYSTLGLQAFTPQRSISSAPKANTRFLRHLIQDTDCHNAALLAKEQRDAKLRSNSRSEAFLEAQRRARSIEERRIKNKDDGLEKHYEHKRHRDSRDAQSHRQSIKRSRESRSRSPKRSRRHDDRHDREKKSRRFDRSVDKAQDSQESMAMSSSRSRMYDDRQDRKKKSHTHTASGDESEPPPNGKSRSPKLSRRHDDRREMESHKYRATQHKDKQRRHGRDHRRDQSEDVSICKNNHSRHSEDEKVYPESFHRKHNTVKARRQSKSRSIPSSLDQDPDSDPRCRDHTSQPANTGTAVLRTNHRSNDTVHHNGKSHVAQPHARSLVEKTSETSKISRRLPATASEPDSDSDPLDAILGPPPPPPGPEIRTRGRGTFTASSGTIDKHFSPGYRASLDVQPDPDSGDDWDQALEAMRDRQRWKQQGLDRLRSAGFSEEQLNRWENGGEKNESDVRWAKSGEGREWDRGKVLDDDGGVELKADWSNTKDESYGRLKNDDNY